MTTATRSPFVGRRRELAALHEAWRFRAAHDGVLVTGPPGIGKTRLVDRFRHCLPHARTVGWRCGTGTPPTPPYGFGAVGACDLVVLDDLDSITGPDIAALLDVRAFHEGALLIGIARSPRATPGGWAHTVTVDALPPADAMILGRSLLPELALAELEPLVYRCAGSPALLVRASAEQATSRSPSRRAEWAA